jgi:hypothetical protein
MPVRMDNSPARCTGCCPERGDVAALDATLVGTDLRQALDTTGARTCLDLTGSGSRLVVLDAQEPSRALSSVRPGRGGDGSGCGSGGDNGAGVFSLWYKSRAGREVDLLVPYIAYWVAGVMVIFQGLLAVTHWRGARNGREGGGREGDRWP